LLTACLRIVLRTQEAPEVPHLSNRDRFNKRESTYINNTKMARLIAVTGATGNQGGSVAKYLLSYPLEYKVRALTRNANSRSAKELEELGAEVVEADLTKPETLPAAVRGCWGVFGVTNFYDAVCARRIILGRC
jgi:hypothetical protein